VPHRNKKCWDEVMIQFVSLSAYRPWFPGFDILALGKIIYDNRLYWFIVRYVTA
jgi:hypothetical protein